MLNAEERSGTRFVGVRIRTSGGRDDVSNESLCLQSGFRSISAYAGVRQHDGSELRTCGLERGTCFSHGGPHGDSAGQQPDFQRVLSVQRKSGMCCCTNRGISELQLDSKRCVGSSLGDSGRAGSGHVYGGITQHCQPYGDPSQRPDVYRTGDADVQLKEPPAWMQDARRFGAKRHE